MVKISDVSERAGVSPGAVSRVLSGDPTLRVSEETRERVLAAVRELRYVPNHVARALRTSRSSNLALVVPDVTSAVFAELTRGAEEEATARGVTLVLARAEQLDADNDWLRRMMGEGRIDGAIVQVPERAQRSIFDALADRDVPVVLINSVDDGPVDTLVLDDAAGIRSAVSHLHSLGHRSVGFVGGVPASATGGRRLAGFLAAAAEFGVDTDGEWMTDLGYGGLEGREASTLLLSRATLPTALVVANLNAALGVLAEIHARGLRVPDDMSIVALHDVWYADAMWPPITTVKMPLKELGSAAVSLLIDHDPLQLPEHRVIDDPKPLLIERASTAVPVH